MSNLISIILPTYNSEKYIHKTIKSIFKQTYQNFQLIIVDDGSTDHTVEIINKLIYKKKLAKLIKLKKNSKTAAIPRNIGLKYAEGDFICFIDSDDIWHESKLEKQLEHCKSKNTIITTKARYFSSNYKSSFFLNLVRGYIQNFIVKKINKSGYHWFYIYNPIILSSSFFNKKIFDKVIFDENLNTREDIDLWIRLRKLNYKYHIINETLVNIRRRDDSLSTSKKKEFVTILGSLINTFFKFQNFEKLNFFLIGVIIKFSIAFIKLNNILFKKITKYSLLLILATYTIIFYTPLFWHVGKPLLYYDDFRVTKNVKNIMIFSGHGSTSLYGLTYQNRYQDVEEILKTNKRINNIFIIGDLSEIPQQKIIEELFKKNTNIKNIEIIYKNYEYDTDFLDYFSNILNKKNVKEIIISTSPYYTKRAKLEWSKLNETDFFIWKSSEWPVKNDYFKYALNKKIIIYEHLKLLSYKLLEN